MSRLKVMRTGMHSVAFVVQLTLWGCKSLTDQNALPAGYVNPESYKTPAGAMGQYNAATLQIQQAFLESTLYSGLLSDELDGQGDVDLRNFGASANAVTVAGIPYETLQLARSFAVQALGGLAKYAPNASPSLRGRIYAFKGYAEILLADLYCSGIPLSELEFEGDFTYKPGSSTKDVYAHAVVLFDSAMALAGTNDSVMNLARVGKGRALLALDSASAASAVVGVVPDNFLQSFTVEWLATQTSFTVPRYTFLQSVSDRAGLNGLPYRTSRDPRTATYSISQSDIFGNSWTVYVPAKYGAIGPSPSDPGTLSSTSTFTMASGIEARLIQAEAALKAGQISTWLGILNTLRTTGNVDGTRDVYSCPVDRDPITGDCPVDSTFARTDTAWQPGTGGVAGLHRIADPGTAVARIDTMFAERAAWLFVDGHRQGDMRRLIRQYGRSQQQVYPIGTYTGIVAGGVVPVGSVYGSDVVFPIPREEEMANPLFHGCIDQKA